MVAVGDAGSPAARRAALVSTISRLSWANLSQKFRLPLSTPKLPAPMTATTPMTKKRNGGFATILMCGINAATSVNATGYA